MPLSPQMVGLRFAAAAWAAGVEPRVTAHSGRVGLASELTSRGASTTDVMLAGTLEDEPDGRALLGRADRRAAACGAVSLSKVVGARGAQSSLTAPRDVEQGKATLEHVPPKIFGVDSIAMCLTCEPCNNSAGRGEQAARMRQKSAKRRPSNGERPGRRRQRRASRR